MEPPIGEIFNRSKHRPRFGLNKQVISLKWTIKQLEALKDTGLSFDETVDVSALTERDSEIRRISPVQVIGRTVFEKDKISFLLQIRGEMVLPSSQTLEDVAYPFDVQTVEAFRLNSSATSEEDEELHDIENETIDLQPYVKEAILVEKPIRVVGNDEKPLSSGKGWTFASEKQKKKRIDPRLKKLEKLLNDDNQ